MSKAATQPEPDTWDWNDAYQGDLRDLQPPDPLLLEVATTLTPGAALDVGCGAGGVLATLAEEGWNVTGIDVAEKAIAAARAVLAQGGWEAELEVADATTYEPNREFDLVTNSFALPVSAQQRSAVFQVVQKALTPGGTFVLREIEHAASAPGQPFAGQDLVSLDELEKEFAGWETERLERMEPTAPKSAGEACSAGGHRNLPTVLFVTRKPEASTSADANQGEG